MAEPVEAGRGTIETPLGVVNYVVNQADHAYLDASGRSEPLVVNRVPYKVSLHLFLIDGAWKVKNYQDLYMSRADRYDAGDASFSAREKTQKILTDAWNEFMKDRQDLLLQGEIHALTDHLQRAEEEFTVLDGKLREARQDIEATQNRLRELGYFGPNKQDWTSRF